jgi:hypothetical protein
VLRPHSKDIPVTRYMREHARAETYYFLSANPSISAMAWSHAGSLPPNLAHGTRTSDLLWGLGTTRYNSLSILTLALPCRYITVPCLSGQIGEPFSPTIVTAPAAPLLAVTVGTAFGTDNPFAASLACAFTVVLVRRRLAAGVLSSGFVRAGSCF